MSAPFGIVGTLAKRFLFSKSSEGFLSFITWVSVVGVSLGVLALTVVTSVINGFEGELAKVVTGMNGDVILYTRAEPIKDPDRVIAQLEKTTPEMQAVTQSFVSELMVSGGKSVAGAVIEGIDVDSAIRVTQIDKKLVSGRLPDHVGEVALVKGLADKLAISVDSTVKLVVPSLSEDGAASPRVSYAKVVGLVRMGMYDYDSKFMYGTLDGVREIFQREGNEVTTFKLKLKSGSSAREISDRLTENFGFPFRAKDWGQLNKNLLYAIQLEKAVISVILTVIILVAAFNVVSTLMMMIHEKTKEIAILKAMGLRPAQSFLLFCLTGVGIGAVGTCAGIFFGMLVNFFLANTRLIELPADIYFFGYLPVVIKWGEIALIGGVALFITFFATLYPSIRVSFRPPLEGLRYDT